MVRKIVPVILVLGTLVAPSTALCKQHTLDDLLEAMIQVESTGNDNAENHAEGAVGPLQIRRSYWDDARMSFGSHRSGPKGQDCWDRKYSKLVTIKYWERYCPWSLRTMDFKTLAQCHNGGGPNLYKKRPPDVQERLDRYWEKVKKELEN